MKALVEILKFDAMDVVTTSTGNGGTSNKYGMGGECGDPELDEE